VRCSGGDRLAHTALSTLALVGALAFVVTGCTETRQQGKVLIVQRIAAANPDSATTVNVDAACASDEKLIGGGYAFPEPPLSSGNPLIIQASYPLSEGSWRIVVTRPQSFDQDRDGIALVASWATCASTPGGQLEVDIVQSALVRPPAGGFFESATAEASCPEESVMTSGGFRVSPHESDQWEVAGLYNSWVWGSAPASQSSWEVDVRRIAGQQGPTPPSMSAYALCAQPPIDSSRLVEADSEKREPINFGYLDGVALCNSDEVASGGGYSFSGDPLVPHVVASSKGGLVEGNWAVTAIHGHQVGEPSGVQVTAICIEVPVIVDVAIVSPRGEICTHCTADVEMPVRVGVDPTDPQMSEPIDFVAEASDGQGDPLTGSALVWTRYTDPAAPGVPLGTGESFTARLPAPPPGEATVGYLIQVVASDPSGNMGSDYVVVIVEADA
jgi:hypothetical protein